MVATHDAVRRQGRDLKSLLAEAHTLARQLRSSPDHLPGRLSARTEALQAVETQIPLLLRCADLVLALDSTGRRSPRRPASRTTLPVIDIGRLNSQGLFDPRRAGGHLQTELGDETFAYKLKRLPDGRSEIVLRNPGSRAETALAIETTSPTFGGARYWIHCAVCNARALRLFIGPARKPVCRACLPSSDRHSATSPLDLAD